MNEIPILLPLAVCFLTTFGCVFLLKPVAEKIGLVDIPGGRRQHARTTPLVGGIAMFLGMLVAMTLLPMPLTSYRGFVLAAGMLVFIGVMDDFHETPPTGRLLAQLIALAIMVFWADIRLDNLGNLFGFGDIQLNLFWAIAVTLFGAATLINAVNFIDGLDGLAGGCMLISFLTLMLLALNAGLHNQAAILAIIATAVLAFLCFNLRVPGRKHAHIFMGDAGSMLLGFILAWFTISLSQGTQPAVSPAIMLWVAGIPLINIATVFIARVLKKQSPFKPSGDHMHCLIQSKGIRANITVFLMLVAAAMLALTALVFTYLDVPDFFVFYGFCALFAVYLLTYFVHFYSH